MTYSHLTVEESMRGLMRIRSDFPHPHPYYIALQSAILHLEEISPNETARLDSVMRRYDRDA